MYNKPKTMHEVATEWDYYVAQHNEKKNPKYVPKPVRSGSVTATDGPLSNQIN